MNRRELIGQSVAVAVARLLRAPRAWGMLFPHGAVASQHDLILNLGQVNYFDPQQLFLNVFKQTGANAN